MARVVRSGDVEFDTRTRELAFALNWERAPSGCAGYWCEFCYFSSAHRTYFQVDHIVSVKQALAWKWKPAEIRHVTNACVLCAACNASKGEHGSPRKGVGLAYRLPNANMTHGPRRARALDFDELVLVASRKGPYRERE